MGQPTHRGTCGGALLRAALLSVCALGAAGGCGEPAVVLYCSVDQEFAERVIAAFESQTGIRVAAKYDTEASKTTGLVRLLEAQRDRPRADVFWSSEVFNTILLARQGLLAPYDSPAAADIPARYKDTQHRWTGFGARARVVAYHSEKFPVGALPKTWRDLAGLAPEVRVAMADPRFGTTRGHVAAMFALWGPKEATKFLRTLERNGLATVLGNAHAVRMTAQGEVLCCMTDTDDVRVAQANGEPVKMVYPDMGDGGTLLIPNTVALVKGAPHGEAARRLVDFLVSAEVERMLARSTSGNFPVRDALLEELQMKRPAASRISFDAIADAMPEAIAVAREILGE